jgi:uncharacterized protein (TIGR04255 family)
VFWNPSLNLLSRQVFEATLVAPILHGPEKQMPDEICYKRNYLTQVIARIEFVAPLGILERTVPAKFSDAVTKVFPIVVPVELTNFAIEMQVGVESTKSNQTRIKQWQFFGKEREKVLSVSSQALDLGYSKYTTYEEVKAAFTEAVETLAKLCPDARVKRFGLRYVNKITIENSTNPTDLNGLISPELSCMIRFFQPENLTRLFHIAELKMGDFDLRFQFGFPNPDYPAVMKRPEFILDMDAYVQIVHDLNESLRYMDGAHEQIQSLFEKSISDVLRSRMNE